MPGDPSLHAPPHPGHCSLAIPITGERDVMHAARKARQMAEHLGFSRAQAYHVATATSELTSNMAVHAGGGTLHLRPLIDTDGTVTGLELKAEDQGPGIADLELAMTDGYSTARRLGCGLPGASRLMDEFSIRSTPGQGTRIKAIKWRHSRPADRS
ncbi:anti-sigma regulatory factor [Ectothiorhodospira shaposhnikovii]|uniref:anti-sigma regulatory factor n=1 Tax=Ectothiorhodospira shaposhnikovii TaxID=1054 RepID=UPI001905D1F3|nr:anti-sigma regulatory factor [Ectothiorhodospira shaposhnikovii]